MPLNAQQQYWWNELRKHLVAEGYYRSRSLESFAHALRQLAVDIAVTYTQPDAQTGQPVLTLPDSTHILRCFTSETERDDVFAAQRAPGTWSEDYFLYPMLQQFGYQTQIILPPTKEDLLGKNYEPYEISAAVSQITLVNKRNEGHWTLVGLENPGGGDCMYYSVAQQIIQDLPQIEQELSLFEAELPSPPVTESEPVTISDAEATAYFTQKDTSDDLRYLDTRTRLATCPTQTLFDLYDGALEQLGNDDNFLAMYAQNVTKKNGGDDFFEQALQTKNFSPDDAEIIREELIHALAREAWRNPAAYAHFIEATALRSPTHTSSSLYTSTCSQATGSAIPPTSSTPSPVST